MSTDIQWTTTCVDSLGLFDLALPVGLVGTGDSPIVTISALIHGDEVAGLLALHRFIEEYVPDLHLRGTIRFIPVANPLGALTWTRTSMLDMLDMNRGGIGYPDGQITERTAYTLYELVKDSTLIINLHEFEADSTIACVYANSGSDQVRLRILKSVLAFGPEVIWSVPRPDVSELRPMLSFDSVVADRGVPVFSVEFPRGDLVTPGTLDKYLSGLVSVLQECDVIEHQEECPSRVQSPMAFQRTPIYTSTMGIWKPYVGLMSEVEQSQIIGELSALPDFSRITFQSPKQGRIIQMRPLEVVRANSILFAVGTSDDQLQAEIDNLIAAGQSAA